MVCMKKNTCIALLAVLLFTACSCGVPKTRKPPTFEHEIFDKLCQKLEHDGFDAKKLNSYYKNPAVTFEQSGISLFFRHNESRLNYDQFLDEASIRKARHYMDTHRIWLIKAEQRFGVDREIITAVLLVETRLGTFLGGSKTFNILSSLAALSDPDNREMFWQYIQPLTDMTHGEYDRRARDKSQWAYSELKSLLAYMDREGLTDPAAITGSYAGASGIPQFMPSNIMKLAVDGDMDGRVDLYTHPDAIMSVASFLHFHGWKPGMDHKDAYNVLLNYNRSSYYANTILEIYEKLQKQNIVKRARGGKP